MSLRGEGCVGRKSRVAKKVMMGNARAMSRKSATGEYLARSSSPEGIRSRANSALYITLGSPRGGTSRLWRGAQVYPAPSDAFGVAAPLVPPGQRVVPTLRRLDLGVVPRVPLEKGDLRVTGEGGRPALWSWAEFAALPRAKITADFHCVTGWARLGG